MTDRERALLVLGATSHRYLGPLAAIRALADDLLGDPATSPRVRDRVGAIRVEARRLETVALRSVTLDRLEADAYIPEEELLRVAELVTRVWAEVGAPGAFAIDDRAGPALAVGDRRSVELTVGILLDNAARHGGAGGVGVRIHCAAPRSGAKSTLRVAVEDRGPGIRRGQRRRLFRAPGRRHADEVSGSGSGLHLARRLARAMDGDVRFADRPGGGSRFTLILPAEIPHAD